MTREDVARLIEVRDAFARRYQEPVGRFVSLGLSIADGHPRLNVLVDDRFDASDLPERFQDVEVDVRTSRAGVLAVGPVQESTAAR